METGDSAERRARQWQSSWQMHDIEAIAVLDAEDCVFRSAPFRESRRGRSDISNYARWAFSHERDPSPRFGAPIGVGTYAVIDYWCVMEASDDGRAATLAVCSLLRFTDDRLVAELRGYWHLEAGAYEPFNGWGT